MKVVIFCGGLGTRLREHGDTIPKPLVNIGYRPIIWHLMRYYAHYGHKDFILCLGYRGDLIKEFFLNYNECISNDFMLSKGGKEIHLFESDIHAWNISFAETGLHSNIGQRLCAVRKYLDGDEAFLANYGDGLSDLPLQEYIDLSLSKDTIANFVCVRTWHSFHAVSTDGQGIVTDFGRVRDTDFWLNGGYFVFRKEIFDYIQEGEELVEQPFQRLISEKKLFAYKYKGFWASMDTLKDKINFDRMYGRGEAPWEVWRK
jgi:glucose-1-phosphate cytidylyltransferase